MSLARSTGGRPWAIWAMLFLAGPVLWYLHFWAVYLLAEAACAAGGMGFSMLGLPGVSVLILVGTVLAGAVTLAATGWAWMRWRKDLADEDDYRRHLTFAGFVLGALFLLSILLVGLPVLVLSPC